MMTVFIVFACSLTWWTVYKLGFMEDELTHGRPLLIKYGYNTYNEKKPEKIYKLD